MIPQRHIGLALICLLVIVHSSMPHGTDIISATEDNSSPINFGTMVRNTIAGNAIAEEHASASSTTTGVEGVQKLKPTKRGKRDEDAKQSLIASEKASEQDLLAKAFVAGNHKKTKRDTANSKHDKKDENQKKKVKENKTKREKKKKHKRGKSGKAGTHSNPPTHSKRSKKSGKSGKKSASSQRPKTWTNTNAPTASPIGTIQVVTQPDLTMGMFGITGMSLIEVSLFEKQTASYMEAFYNDNLDSNLDRSVFNAIANVTFKEQDYQGVTINKIGLGDRNLQDVPLIVTYETVLSYHTSNPDVNPQSLTTAPFASDAAREYYINEYLKVDGMFEGLNGITAVELPDTPDPTEYPTSMPTFAPTIVLYEDDVIINTTFHLTLVQDSFLNITSNDTAEIGNITLQFLFDNIGGENKFTPDSLVIGEIANSIQEDRSGELIKTLAFQMNVSFSMTPDFLEWIDEEGTVDSRRLLGSLNQRRLQNAKCGPKDYADCCLNGAINKDADSKACKKAGCKRNRCRKKPPKNRLLMESKYASDIRISHGRGLQTESNLWGLNFLDVIKDYTTNFEPKIVKSVLNATDTDAVASCSVNRFADESGSGSFTCDVYEGNNCRENEDIEFEPNDEFCRSAMPSFSPSFMPTLAPSISSMPSFSAQPSPQPSQDMTPGTPSNYPTSPSDVPTSVPSISSIPSVGAWPSVQPSAQPSAQLSIDCDSNTYSISQCVGIKESIEGQVLQRGAVFGNMDDNDPRFLSLDWILNKDTRDMEIGENYSILHQRYILALLAYAWERSDWLSNADECTWYGVSCTTGGNVRGLDWSETNLIGEIPPEISELQYIHYIYLDANNLNGTIPPELGKLSNLQSLVIYYNGMTGTIPESLYNLTELTFLDLYSNQFSGTISKEIGNLKKLQGLYLGDNLVSGTIPTEMGLCNDLRYLLIYNNGMTGTIPESVYNLTELKDLYLHSNQFSGTISKKIGNLKKLQYLDLLYNFFSGTLPTEMGLCNDLRYLLIYNNGMTGTIPESLYNLTELYNLDLRSNQFSGTISKNIGNLKQLDSLFLSDNLFSGTLPTELGLCNDLIWLYIQDNGMTGTIPESLYNLTELYYLDLRSNQFSGRISKEIGNLKKLQYLDLRNNLFSGTLPTELGLCDVLRTLFIDRTNINGSVPEEVCQVVEEDNSGYIYADCDGTNPFISCDCCSVCYVH